jgi:hypothetical protein
VELPWKTVEEVRSAHRFGSLEAFLSDLFRVGQVLRRRQDFYDLTLAYLRQAAEESVVREMFFGARAFLDLGVSISEQLAARSTRWTYSSSSIGGLTASSGLASGPPNVAIRQADDVIALAHNSFTGNFADPSAVRSWSERLEAYRDEHHRRDELERRAY